jgi:hypothetical protein
VPLMVNDGGPISRPGRIHHGSSGKGRLSSSFNEGLSMIHERTRFLEQNPRRTECLGFCP